MSISILFFVKNLSYLDLTMCQPKINRAITISSPIESKFHSILVFLVFLFRDRDRPVSVASLWNAASFLLAL